MRLFFIALFAAGALAAAATAQSPCPGSHYQCSPGVCCPK
jgi:hypothetical protein